MNGEAYLRCEGRSQRTCFAWRVSERQDGLGQLHVGGTARGGGMTLALHAVPPVPVEAIGSHPMFRPLVDIRARIEGLVSDMNGARASMERSRGAAGSHSPNSARSSP